MEAFMMTSIRPIKNNYRYRLVIHDWEYYLLDTEKNILSIFFPLSFWLTKQTLYKIDRKRMESLRLKTVSSSNYPEARWHHLWMVILLPVLRPIYELVISIPGLKNSHLLIGLAIIFISIRLFVRDYFGRQLKEEGIHLMNHSKKSIKIKPFYKKQWAYHLGMTFFFDLGVFFSILFYLDESSLGALLTFLLFFPLRLFIFTLFFSNPAIEDSYRHKLRIFD